MADPGDKRKYYKWNKEDLQRALLAYERKEMSLNKISATYLIPKPTILRHAKKTNKIAVDSNIQKGRPPVFNQEIEDKLAHHILELEKYMFGLTINNIRCLAYDIAEKHNIPNNFNKDKRMAGKEWFYKFMKRHPELSIRQPESTSLNRIKGFNRENVFHFFDLLEKIVDDNRLGPTNIFNVDESGFSTVQKKPQKIIGLKGKKQVGAATSGERGVNTTAVCCASVSGQFVPPMLIFKRMRQNPELANGAPLGSIVTVSESGYINSNLFVEWLQHFINVVKPTPEKKVLLLLDGHTTHSKNLEALCLAKDNGIILLQLPGHTTNRIQPLDVSFFKPLSTYYIQATEKWLRTNPGRQVTQYQVSQLFGEAYERAAAIGNVVNGFKASGIWPVNRHIFPEYMFDAAENLLNDNTSSPSTTTEPNQSETSPTPSKNSVKSNETGLKEKDNTDMILNVTTRTKKSKKENIDTKQIGNLITENEKENKKGKLKKQDVNLINKNMVTVEIHNPPSTSKTITQPDVQSVSKTIKTLSPIPKNTLRKRNTIQKAVEITSSPYKKQLEEKATNKKKTPVKVQKKKVGRPKKDTIKVKQEFQKKITPRTKPKTKSNKRKRSPSSSSTDSQNNDTMIVQLDDDDDTDDDLDDICALCNGRYYDTKGPKVDWIQCVRCHRWLHETCTSNPDICESCFN